MQFSVIGISWMLLLPASFAFMISTPTTRPPSSPTTTTQRSVLFLAKGFGAQNDDDKKKHKKKKHKDSTSNQQITSSSSNNKNQIFDRTYGGNKDNELVASESIMSDFFQQHVDWHPLFRSLSASSSVPAMTHINEDEADTIDFEFHASSLPWKQLDAIPTNDQDKQVIGSFLDSMQQALIDMPNTSDESPLAEDDLPFVEEGRRMLAVSRFQVIRTNNQQDLFETCWNELTTLSRDDVQDTGSLIILPDLDEWDFLESFCSSRVHQPLEWLGMHDSFEIATIQRSSIPAVRLLHKLSEIPDLTARGPAPSLEEDDDTDDDTDDTSSFA